MVNQQCVHGYKMPKILSIEIDLIFLTDKERV